MIDFPIKRFKGISSVYDSEISLNLNSLKPFFIFYTLHYFPCNQCWKENFESVENPFSDFCKDTTELLNLNHSMIKNKIVIQRTS